jgi:hypothetical protein
MTAIGFCCIYNNGCTEFVFREAMHVSSPFSLLAVPYLFPFASDMRLHNHHTPANFLRDTFCCIYFYWNSLCHSFYEPAFPNLPFLPKSYEILRQKLYLDDYCLYNTDLTAQHSYFFTCHKIFRIGPLWEKSRITSEKST